MPTTFEPSIGSGADRLRRVREILGTPPLKTEQDVVRLIERRLPTAAIDALRRSGMVDEEIFTLVLPRRTLAHRRSRGEALTREESDRAVRFARLVALGEQVFGESERFWRWMRAAKRQMRGKIPLQLAATEAGARLVEEWLYRIDEGMAA